MAAHTEDALRSPRISQVLNLSLAVATAKACAAKSLVAGEDGEVLDLVAASIAAVSAVVTYQAAVAKKQEVGIAVEEGAYILC